MLLETVPGDNLFSLAHPQLFPHQYMQPGHIKFPTFLLAKLSHSAAFWVTIKHKWSGWLAYSKIWINNLYLFLLTSLNLFPQSKEEASVLCWKFEPILSDRWAFLYVFSLRNPLVSPIKMSSGEAAAVTRRGDWNLHWVWKDQLDLLLMSQWCLSKNLRPQQQSQKRMNSWICHLYTWDKKSRIIHRIDLGNYESFFLLNIIQKEGFKIETKFS